MKFCAASEPNGSDASVPIDADRLVPVLEDWWPRFPGYHL